MLLQRCTNGEIIRNKFNHSLIGKLLSEICPALQQDPVISSSPKYPQSFFVPRIVYTSPTHGTRNTQIMLILFYKM